MARPIFYYFPRSGPCRGALLAIRNLNIDVELKEVNLVAKEQLNKDFLKINPQHTVPTIDDNGYYLWESRAISTYLVDSKAPGNSLYPKDAKLRGLIDQKLYFDAGTFYPRIRAICFPILFLGETTVSKDKREQLDAAFKFMNTFLEGKKYFCGDTLTLADLSLLASTSSIVHVGVDLSPYPNVKAWYESCKTVPGFAENDAGAALFGNAVKSKLTEKF